MKSPKLISIIATATIALASCTEDIDSPGSSDTLPGDRAATIEVPLRLHAGAPVLVGKPLVNDIPSRAEGDAGSDETPVDPEKAAEEAIHDIWVFQYDQNGNQLIMPRYYEVSSTEIKKLNIRLAEGVDSHVYVLANTCDPEWAKGKDFSTIEKFVGYEYPFTEDNVEMGADEYLFMEGSVKETIRKESDLLPIDIHLTRMMAKISFKYVTAAAAANLVVNRVIINNMPTHMRMEETPSEENYPQGDDFETKSVTLDKSLASGMVYTFYMPANRRGTSTNTDPKYKNNGAPDKALYVQLFVSSKTNGSNYLYTIYLGENDYNDFNVRRNHNYNITLNINSEERDDRVLAAPANCFVLGFKEEIMFDPYTRTETGGGWKYSEYVNKKEEAKRIETVKVLWQEQNVIGNNSSFDKVWLDEYDRIHVKSASTAGNAVIAGYNAANEIVWSWHIWVNDEKPAEISKAVAYKTFPWDKSGIITASGRTVQGRALMSCNLGAKKASGTGLPTYGAVYQWGRKDPFPIGWKLQKCDPHYNYTTANIGTLTDNSNAAIKMTTEGTVHTTELFGYELTNETYGKLEYVIKHPTVFIGSATKMDKTAGPNYNNPTEFTNNGDWFWGGEDRLWGGTPYKDATLKVTVHPAGSTHLGTTQVVAGILSNNGAKEKSIFDPCPAGWMVPPGDMWLAFTVDGKNSGWNDIWNYVNAEKQSSDIFGHKVYVTDWHKGKTVYFPSQGYRNAGGSCWRNGGCGNYHTSTPGENGTVNCFHIHSISGAFPFEPGYGSTRRAFAGPVRCVRDVD